MSDDDSEDPLAIALEDARRLVDQQDGLMERNERELVRIIWLNVLLLGGMVPALEVLRPEDGTFFKSLDPGLPWFVLAVFLIIMAIFFGSLTYRGNLLHGGFEDSPNLAVADLTWKSLGGPAEDDFPGVDAFDADATENAEAMRARLLWDYGKGIRHNNRETTYRFQVVDWVTRLMVLGIV